MQVAGVSLDLHSGSYFFTLLMAEHAANIKILTTTTVAPTGVEITMDILIPTKAAVIAITADDMITFLKLSNSLMDERAGNTISAEVRRAPQDSWQVLSPLL